VPPACRAVKPSKPSEIATRPNQCGPGTSIGPVNSICNFRLNACGSYTAPGPIDNRPWRNAMRWKNANGYYQHLWWCQTRPDGSYVYMARGNTEQQWIYVSPWDHVVIVRFGLVDFSADWWPDIFKSVTANLK
jgi:hypothetical protein